MFIDEILKKIDCQDLGGKFTLALFGDSYVVITGIKSVLVCNSEAVTLRVKRGSLNIEGSDLDIREVGGSEVYISGKIEKINVLT